MAHENGNALVGERYDVVIIGAGVVGCCTARELARYDARVLVLEAGPDIACGATRANSGIVHTGFDPQPGSLKAAYNVRGAQMFESLQRELGFSYRKNGALVVAFSAEELQVVEELRERAAINGAPTVRVIGPDELYELEPALGSGAVGALQVPDSGIVDPYGFALAMAENAADNGVTFAFGVQVVGVERADAAGAGAAGAAGAGAAGAASAGYRITLADGTVVKARAVVNAAGVFADEINNMVSAEKLRIAPRKGEYHLYKEGVRALGHTVFAVPTAAGKGVLVGSSTFGNQFVGPNAEPLEDRTDVATSAAGLAEVLDQAERLWPGCRDACVISNFAGVRATNALTGDFVVGPVADAPGFFNLACIDSPGLASSPALGQDAAAWAAAYVGAGLRPDFQPRRVPAPLLFLMSEEQRAELVAADPRFGVKICGCANVTEGEVVAALHRPLPVTCLDALKWRTGVTMGECQGGRCVARLLEVMARELGVEASAVCKRGPESPLVADVRCACEVPLPEKSRWYEKPRSMYGVPGSRPAGVFSAYGALCVMARTGYLPGQRVLVWGQLPMADECAATLERVGAEVVRVSEGRVVLVEGAGRVSAVTVELPGGQRERHACDTLVMADERLLHEPVGH